MGICIFCIHFLLIAPPLQNDDLLYCTTLWKHGFQGLGFCSAKGLQKGTLAWPDTTHYELPF